jgi:hypothetical protein
VKPPKTPRRTFDGGNLAIVGLALLGGCATSVEVRVRNGAREERAVLVCTVRSC